MKIETIVVESHEVIISPEWDLISSEFDGISCGEMTLP